MITLPSTRTFAWLALGSFLVFPAGSILFGDRSVNDLPGNATLAAQIAAGSAFLVLAYSLGAVMVRLFFAKVRQRVAPHSPRLSTWLGDARHCERLILALWAVWSAGIVIVAIALLTGAIPT